MIPKGEFRRGVRASRRRPVPLALALLVSLSSSLSAQTAQPAICTVSILNQSATVRPDGTWDIFNVPSNMGPVRARLNCVGEGQVESGASGYFTVTRGRMNAIDGVPLGSAPPTPERLAISAPTVRLTTPGETVQLTVSAHFPGGATVVVSAAAAGTVYATTNPRVATVSPEGLVTAIASGRVLITALHEAILAAFAIDVVLAADSDGDGLADDFELANGLDPNNAVDALDDADGDGLSTLDEFQTGLDPRNPDTDGDALLDGREVETTATNPLLFDTDGDGLGDGLEIAGGSNPLDPLSFNLAAALSAVEVTPQSLSLIVSTLGGEVSRQLTVLGRLVDGRTIDLTEPRYGTLFTSTNLAVCNFGAEPGRVFAGGAGSCTVTASNGGFSGSTLVTVQSFSPTVLAAISLPPFANDVEVSGDTVFVAGGPAGLHVIDVTNRAAPSLLATLALPGNANDVRVRGNLVFIAGGAAGLHVIDAADPESPQLVATLNTAGDAIDLAVSRLFVYVADRAAGFAIVEVDTSGQPILRGTLDTPGLANGLEVAGGGRWLG